MMKMTLAEVRRENSNWFSRSNMRFFGDIYYRLRKGKVTKTYYLVRYTSAWTDMFDGIKKYHFIVNPINQETLEILPHIDKRFWTMEEVEDWLIDEADTIRIDGEN